jgi:formyltetrahydrofolate synthetase
MKIAAIATNIYGAVGVTYEPAVEEKIAAYTAAGYDKLPICMAKTHLSLSTGETGLLVCRSSGAREIHAVLRLRSCG